LPVTILFCALTIAKEKIRMNKAKNLLFINLFY
jgi:hypothetical protein